MRIVVIGGNAAGITAASQAKRRAPGAEVVVFEGGAQAAYDAYAIPYNLADPRRNLSDLVVVTAAELERRGVDLRPGQWVRALDPKRRSLTVLDRASGREREEPYDRLVLCTGARAVEPPFTTQRPAGVFTVHGIDDAVAVKKWLEQPWVRRAVVVGAGPLGLEWAEALRTRGLEVTLLERAPHVLPCFGVQVADLAAAELERNGVQVVTGAVVGGVALPDSGRGLSVITEREHHAADLVLMATGLRPNVELAQRAGLRLGDSGAIAVDAAMRTSAEGIFAAGECAETFHRVTGRPHWVPLATASARQGRVAGDNAAGGEERYTGIVGTLAFKVFDLEVARTGLDHHELQRHKLEVVPVFTQHLHCAEAYGGARRICTLLYIEEHSGRLLGAQMAGAPPVAKRIDVLATAITASMSVDQIAELDLSYAPPLAPLWDPVVAAAVAARKQVRWRRPEPFAAG